MELDARIQMHEASTLAGLAFDAAGLGVCHAIAHQVGANFKVPHGLANSMLLPYVIQANSKDKETRKIMQEFLVSLVYVRRVCRTI